MTKLHWLSFADGELPSGSQFLGVSIVTASDFGEAVQIAWDMNINPGGEVMGLEIPDDMTQAMPDSYKGRLLTKADCEALEVILESAKH